MCAVCLPGAQSAAIGAYVVEGGLCRVSLLFPLPFVDDELPLEMGEELEVLLLLGHTYYLNSHIMLVSCQSQRNILQRQIQSVCYRGI